MSAVRVKICGLTRPGDVDDAVNAGADAVGFVFARKSPRLVTPSRAEELARRVPRGVLRVGLFMDPEAEDVAAVLDVVELDLIQFHGAETNAFCAAFGLPFLKAVSMLETNPDALAASFPGATGILLDSHSPGGAGGTGRTFDWERRIAADKPIWLAGGLNPDNVAEAVARFHPYAVDVSSGVEQAPGIKHPERVRQFIINARQAVNDSASHANTTTDPS